MGGADTVVVNDLTGTAVNRVNLNLAASAGGSDATLDEVVVNGTAGNDNIVVTVVEIRGDKVRLGIQAPKEVPVHRSEVHATMHAEKSQQESPVTSTAET